MSRGKMTERETSRAAFQLEAIRAAAPIILEIVRQGGNIVNSSAQAAATSPVAGATAAMVVGSLLKPFDKVAGNTLQAGALGYLGLETFSNFSEAQGSALGSILESLPLSGDAPDVSNAVSITFDTPDQPPGIAAPAPNLFLEAFLRQQGKK